MQVTTPDEGRRRDRYLKSFVTFSILLPGGITYRKTFAMVDGVFPGHLSNSSNLAGILISQLTAGGGSWASVF
jgi:hypothetical protein